MSLLLIIVQSVLILTYNYSFKEIWTKEIHESIFIWFVGVMSGSVVLRKCKRPQRGAL